MPVPQSDAFKQAVIDSRKLVAKPSQDELLNVCFEFFFFVDWWMVDNDEGEFVGWIYENGKNMIWMANNNGEYSSTHSSSKEPKILRSRKLRILACLIWRYAFLSLSLDLRFSFHALSTYLSSMQCNPSQSTIRHILIFSVPTCTGQSKETCLASNRRWWRHPRRSTGEICCISRGVEGEVGLWSW